MKVIFLDFVRKKYRLYSGHAVSSYQNGGWQQSNVGPLIQSRLQEDHKGLIYVSDRSRTQSTYCCCAPGTQLRNVYILCLSADERIWAPLKLSDPWLDNQRCPITVSANSVQTDGRIDAKFRVAVGIVRALAKTAHSGCISTRCRIDWEAAFYIFSPNLIVCTDFSNKKKGFCFISIINRKVF